MIIIGSATQYFNIAAVLRALNIEIWTSFQPHMTCFIHMHRFHWTFGGLGIIDVWLTFLTDTSAPMALQCLGLLFIFQKGKATLDVPFILKIVPVNNSTP